MRGEWRLKRSAEGDGIVGKAPSTDGEGGYAPLPVWLSEEENEVKERKCCVTNSISVVRKDLCSAIV